ncbi:MAG: hypothetical protein JEY99_18425 [Spirochaetales bacterium]|nr:hypothetical protein [Spirochaetales bacterium]
MNNNLKSIKNWLNSDSSGFTKINSHLSKNIDDFFKYIFNTSTDGVGLIDLNLNIIGVNNAMSDWYADKRPFLGEKCYETYHGRSSPCDDCPSLVSMKTGRMQSSIVPYESETEQWGEQVLSTFPVMNEEHKVVAIIEYVRDMTKEEKGQQAMKNLTSMLDSQSSKIMEQELALGVLGRQLSDKINNSYVNLHDNLHSQVMPLIHKILRENRDKELANHLETLNMMLLKLDSNAMDSSKIQEKDLTFREKQIAGYIQKGLSSKEISDILCISKKTVDFHRTNLRKKFRIDETQADLKSFLMSEYQ